MSDEGSIPDEVAARLRLQTVTLRELLDERRREREDQDAADDHAARERRSHLRLIPSPAPNLPD